MALHARLLIADRDARYAEWLRHHLGVICPENPVYVLEAAKFATLEEAAVRAGCDLLLLGARFGENPDDPDSEGLQLLRRFRGRDNVPPAVVLAEDGNELTAVRAVQLGALDYVPKRMLTHERLKTVVRLALHRLKRRAARRLETRALGHAQDDNEAKDDASQATLPPDFIPGYTLAEPLGQSSYAVVYRAQSAALVREVALKITRIESDEPHRGQLLAREYAALASLRDPAVVRIFDYGNHAGREYLAMEYFRHGDLKARLQRGIDEAEALKFLERIAAALRVVHRAGLLHRDLKPPNVMLRDDDEVALIDFGLARHLEGGLNSTRTGVLRGSPYYMSPEQALGEDLDGRTDLYSLGIIFFEMLTGRKPYVGHSAIEVLQEHVNGALPQLPSNLAHHQPMLDRLLAKSRKLRYSSADELLSALLSPAQSSNAA